MPEWTNDLPNWLDGLSWMSSEPIYLVLGALLAGSVGYITDDLKARRETRAMRKYQLITLGEELRLLDTQSLPSLESKVLPTPEIHVTMLPLVLHSQALSYSSDGELLAAAFRLYQSIHHFNDLVAAKNKIEVGLGTGRGGLRDQMIPKITEALEAVKEDRDLAIQCLKSVRGERA